MLEQKQIEEMNEIVASKICEAYSPICDEWQPHNCGKCYANDTHINEISEALYNAGYRKQEWISVDDRLPDKYNSVLIFCEGEVRIDYIDSYGIWHDNFQYRVTHWMPLPEPPKMKGGAE